MAQIVREDIRSLLTLLRVRMDGVEIGAHQRDRHPLLPESFADGGSLLGGDGTALLRDILISFIADQLDTVDPQFLQTGKDLFGTHHAQVMGTDAQFHGHPPSVFAVLLDGQPQRGVYSGQGDHSPSMIIQNAGCVNPKRS